MMMSEDEAVDEKQSCQVCNWKTTEIVAEMKIKQCEMRKKFEKDISEICYINNPISFVTLHAVVVRRTNLFNRIKVSTFSHRVDCLRKILH